VTAALHVLPTRRPRPPAPHLHPGAEFLTVTAHPVAPGLVVIRVCGEVDLLTSSLMFDGLLAHPHGPGDRLIVDLTEVDFLGAAGLTVLAAVGRATHAVGVGLGLVANTRAVLLPLTAGGMRTRFDIHPDLAHALRDAGGAAAGMAP
jgi:anti-sigma B factor antagonist